MIDVFYKSLSYVDITVNNAFPFISLLSEFGGFMGLLLGASCMTLCEIFDYIIIWTLSRLFKNKTKANPSYDNRISDSEMELHKY